MDNTTLFAIFLAAVAVSLVINAGMLFVAGRAVSKITSEFARKARAVGPGSEIRQSLDSLLDVSGQVLRATEQTRQRMSELAPQLQDMQARYGELLVTLSANVDRVATGLTDSALRVRDACEKPARKFGGYANNIQNAFGFSRIRADE